MGRAGRICSVAIAMCILLSTEATCARPAEPACRGDYELALKQTAAWPTERLAPADVFNGAWLRRMVGEPAEFTRAQQMIAGEVTGLCTGTRLAAELGEMWRAFAAGRLPSEPVRVRAAEPPEPPPLVASTPMAQAAPLVPPPPPPPTAQASAPVPSAAARTVLAGTNAADTAIAAAPAARAAPNASAPTPVSARPRPAPPPPPAPTSARQPDRPQQTGAKPRAAEAKARPMPLVALGSFASKRMAEQGLEKLRLRLDDQEAARLFLEGAGSSTRVFLNDSDPVTRCASLRLRGVRCALVHGTQPARGG